MNEYQTLSDVVQKTNSQNGYKSESFKHAPMQDRKSQDSCS